jgi:hypothetical protein
MSLAREKSGHDACFGERKIERERTGAGLVLVYTASPPAGARNLSSLLGSAEGESVQYGGQPHGAVLSMHAQQSASPSTLSCSPAQELVSRLEAAVTAVSIAKALLSRINYHPDNF